MQEKNSEKISIVLVDDQELFRSGLSVVLNSQSDFEVIGEAGNGAEALNLLKTVQPDILLLDVRMPVMDGVETVRQLFTSEEFSHRPKVILLTTFNLDEASAAAIRYGASGFILKDATPDFLAESIRAVYSGNSVIAPNELKQLFERFSEPKPQQIPSEFHSLTDREKEIFALVSSGLSNGEIAQNEFLSESTVKTHISSILAKLNLRDRVQIVVYAHRHQIV